MGEEARHIQRSPASIVVMSERIETPNPTTHAHLRPVFPHADFSLGLNL